jgi:hypothetical protein
MNRSEEKAVLAAKFAAFPVGTRVVFTEDSDRFPDFVVPRGTTGVVSDSCPDGVLVKVDGDVPGLTDSSEWRGEFQWLVPHVEDMGEPEAPFARACDGSLDCLHAGTEPLSDGRHLCPECLRTSQEGIER